MNLRITNVKWNIKAFKTAYGKVFIKDESTGKIYEEEFIFEQGNNAINMGNIYKLDNNNIYQLVNRSSNMIIPNLELIKL